MQYLHLCFQSSAFGREGNQAMGKDPEFLKQQILREMLQIRRQKAGLSQRQLAEILDKPQSWVCRHERGDLRMDYMELRAYLKALGASVVAFVSALERKLAEVDEE